jgi:hypothetical protein
MVMVGLAPFEPINQVTPFTYRDNDTYLTILKKLTDKTSELVAFINDVSENNAGGLNALWAELTAAIVALRAELVAMIEALENEETPTTALDPTNGTRTESISKVIGRVYDYSRVFGYFARQYDELEMTAAEYDAQNLSARHYDLGVTYPVLNDTQPA